MRKVVVAFLVAILAVMTLAGCSSPKEPPQTPPVKADIKDQNALFDFVKANIKNISKETFNEWVIEYLDITGDGNDEAIIVSTYGVDWHDKLEIVSVAGGEYKIIPCELGLGKYGNHVLFEDGFLVLLATAGGSGISDTYMTLAVYDGTRMVTALSDLLVEATVALDPNNTFEVRGEIQSDSLKGFAYVQTKYDAKGETILERGFYLYNEDTMSFDVDPYFEGPNGDDLGLAKFTNEIINGTQVNYSEYSGVVVPMYNGVNKSILASFDMMFGHEGTTEKTVAIFGELQNAMLTYYEGLDNKVVDQSELGYNGVIYDAFVTIYTNLPNDFCYIELTGKINGKNISVVLDDMRDITDLELVLVR